MRNPIAHLPKSLQALPAVKALRLKVYDGDGPKHYKVPGDSAIYDVHFFGGSYICGCPAGSNGAVCAHSIAAKHYRESKQEKA